MNIKTAELKTLLKFEFTAFKATFSDVDYGEHEEERYFSSEDKAKAWLIEFSKGLNIEEDDIPWRTTSTGGQYFNYQFQDHPIQGHACYHGSYEQIEID